MPADDSGFEPLPPREHQCVGGRVSKDPTDWVIDVQRIPLFRACDACKDEKLARYRPEILTGYDQSDVDEPIEPEDGSLGW